MFVGAGVDTLKWNKDEVYRSAILRQFNCLFPQKAFKFNETVDRSLNFQFNRRNAFLKELPFDMPYRINCLFWDASMRKILGAVSVNDRWKFVREWLTCLLNPVKSSNCIGVDVINEPLRLYRERAVFCPSMAKLLGESWIEQGIDLVREVRPDLPLFINQHQIRYRPIQDAVKSLADKFPGINFAFQCTTSFFGVNKFDKIAVFIDELPKSGIIHIPEITVWRYHVGNKDLISTPLGDSEYLKEDLKQRQMKAYSRLIDSILLSKRVSCIGFWEPYLGRSFYYQGEEPGFLNESGIIDNEELERRINECTRLFRD